MIFAPDDIPRTKEPEIYTSRPNGTVLKSVSLVQLFSRGPFTTLGRVLKLPVQFP